MVEMQKGERMPSWTAAPSSGSDNSVEIKKLWDVYSSPTCPSNPFYAALLKWADEGKNEAAISWIDSNCNVSHRFSRYSFLRETEEYCLYFKEKLMIKLGDKVILCFPPGPEFYPVFWACLCSGIVAVPVYPPDPSKAQQDILRFLKIQETTESNLIFTTSFYRKVANLLSLKYRDSRWKSIKWICVDSILRKRNSSSTDLATTASSGRSVPAFIQPNFLAFLQFTSGSTSSPKGVIVTHGNLLHNCHLCSWTLRMPSWLEDPQTNLSLTPVPFTEFWRYFEKRHEISKRVLNHPLSSMSWLPVYHDMGLIGSFIAPVFFGISCFFLSPLDFMRKPYLWLEAMSRYDCACNGSPNFAFDLVVRKMPDSVYEKLDLSKVFGLLCGAEPIRCSTILKFLKKFAPKGLRPEVFLPAYGLAEHTLIVSGEQRFEREVPCVSLNLKKLQMEGNVELCASQPYLDIEEMSREDMDPVMSVSFMSCGWTHESVDVRIVDPSTLNELSENKQGEIWVRSSSCAGGYYNRPDLSSETFKASCRYLTGLYSPGCYLRTGDLGFVHKGELYVSGRLKDILIIRGRNYFPQDIEEVVENRETIRAGCSAAFSIDRNGVEILGVAAEVRLVKQKGMSKLLSGVLRCLNENMVQYCTQLAQDIVASVSSSIGIPVHEVWLLSPHTILKTSSGKIRRSETRSKLYSGGVSNVLLHYKPFENITTTPTARLSTTSKKNTSTVEKISPEISDIRSSDSRFSPSSIPTPLTRTSSMSCTALDDATRCVEEVVRESAKSVLGVSDDFLSKEEDRPLLEFGIDSLGIVEFTDKISTALEIDITPTVMFEHPTIRDLINYLGEKIVEIRKPDGHGNLNSPLGSEAPALLSPSSSCEGGAVVLIGVSCRLPGEVYSLEKLSELLITGKDAIVVVPPDRWNVDKYYDPNPDAEGMMYIREGGFIQNAELFDYEFFRISKANAKGMDPQQRIFLEVAYEALHDASFELKDLYQANIGMFVGCCSIDWTILLEGRNEPITPYTAVNQTTSLLSNRVSYSLGMTGPSLTIDTACSSSLVALHMALRELRANSCQTAVVGGVNLMMSPKITVAFCKSGMMATDARCRTFDASANGYVRGEGFVSLVLQQERCALATGLRRLARLRGSAVNHGGRAACLTAPTGFAQQLVISKALAEGGLSPHDVDAVEAHGTGTALGDPIEVSALKAVFASGRDETNSLAVTALKTNIGHLEGAAGAAGILKCLIMAQYKVVPWNVHLKQLNPMIDIEKFSVKFPRPAVAHSGPLNHYLHKGKVVVGVSSFGFGGANSHVILESMEDADVVASSSSTSVEPDSSVQTNYTASPRIAFLFPGQGSQYVNMGKDLFDSQPVFHDAMIQCADILDEILPSPLLHVLYPSEYVTAESIQTYSAKIELTQFAQPAIVALEYSMTKLLESRGIKPSVVMGHSLGEYVAAVVSEVMTLKDCLRLVAERARLMSETPEQDGVMVATRLAPEAAEAAIATLDRVQSSNVVVAVINGPRSIVLSGTRGDVNAVLETSDAVKRSKYIDVSHAFHSPLMTPVVEPIQRIVDKITLSPPKIKFVSCVSGDCVTSELETPLYWAEHIVRPVNFHHGMKTVLSTGVDVIVEVGSQAVLTLLGRQCVEGASISKRVTWINVLQKPGVGDVSSNGYENAMSLFHDIGINVEPIREIAKCSVQSKHEALPWSQAEPVNESVKSSIKWKHVALPWNEAEHPILAGIVNEPSRGVQGDYRIVFSRPLQTLLMDHVIGGRPLVPGAVFIEMASAVGGQWLMKKENISHATVVLVENLEIVSPLEILTSSAGEDISLVEVTLSMSFDGRFAIRSHGQSEKKTSNVQSEAMEHVTGRVSVCPIKLENGNFPLFDMSVNLQDLKQRLRNSSVNVEQFYGQLENLGLQYGTRFRSIRELYRSHEEVLAHLVQSNLYFFEQGFNIHPALLDSAFQSAALLIAEESSVGSNVFVPVTVAEVVLKHEAMPTDLWSYVKLKNRDAQNLQINVTLFDIEGNLVAYLKHLYFRCINSQDVIPKQLLWETEWVEWTKCETVIETNLSEKGDTLSSGSFSGYNRTHMDPEDGSSFLMSDVCLLLLAVPEWASANLEGSIPSAGKFRIETGRIPPSSKLQEIISSTIWDAVVYMGGLCTSKTSFKCMSEVLELSKLMAAELSHSTINASNRLILVTRGCQRIHEELVVSPPLHGGLIGFVRSARLELEASTSGRVLQLNYIDLEDERIDSSEKVVTTVAEQLLAAIERLMYQSFETEVAVRQSNYLVPRLLPSTFDSFQGAIELHMQARGSLSNLQLKPMVLSLRRNPRANECELRIRAIGLNFRDVLNVMGLYPGDPGPPGVDCAGTVVNVGEGVSSIKVGDSVFGLSSGCMKSFAMTDARLVCSMPSCMSFEAAAAMPVIGVTVELALRDLANVKAGEIVLVHAASGGVGILALQFCRSVGARVFATVGSEAKQKYVESFGDVVEEVSSSRDCSKFREDMENACQRLGKMDVVLNCLSNEYISASLKFLKNRGRFMELGKRGIWTTEEMSKVRPDVYYECVAVDVMTEKNPTWMSGMLERIRKLVESNQMEAPPLRVYDMSNPSKDDGGLNAFRYLQRALHIGKVILKIPSAIEARLPPTTSSPSSSDFDRKAESSRPNVYVITGGLGALGLVISQWLVEEGARHLVLLSRKGPPCSETIASSRALRWLLSPNANLSISIVKCDVSKKDEVRAVLQEISKQKNQLRIKGIFHAAGVVRDAPFQEQTLEKLQDVFRPKLEGAWNLHETCEQMGINQDLDFFVTFSSISGLVGNFGQSTYAAANAALDAFIQYRRSWGFCGMSVQWGPWTDQGMAVNLKQSVEKVGLHGIPNDLGLRVLHHILKTPSSSNAVVACQAFNWRRFFLRYEKMTPAFFANISFTASSGTISSKKMTNILSMNRTELAYLLVGLVEEARQSSVKIEIDVPLLELDLDSLGMMEFRNTVAQKTGVKPHQTLLFENPTLIDIADHILRQHGKIEGPATYSEKETVSGLSLLSLSTHSVPTTPSVPSTHSAGYLQHKGIRELRSNDDENSGVLFSASSGVVSSGSTIRSFESSMSGRNNTFCASSFCHDSIKTCVSSSTLSIWDDTYSSPGVNMNETENLGLHLLFQPEDGTTNSLSQDGQQQPIHDIQTVVQSLQLNTFALKHPTPVHRVKRVFLTGVTGFIGRLQIATLLNLISHPKLVVYCLVRASSKEHAMQRIQKACETANCWKPEYTERIVPILGDLSEERFGIDYLTFRRLCETIDIVYHTGADINLLKSYARLRTVNVLSLKTIIDICTTYKQKPLHYVSTLGIFPAYFASFQCEYSNIELSENIRPSAKEMQFFPCGRMGYPWSKWAAEIILTEARAMGVSVTIYRLPITCMAYSTGYTHTDNVNLSVIAATLQEGMIPIGISFTAISAADVVCELLVELSLVDNRNYWVYHLVDTRIIGRSRFLEWFEQLGLTFRSVTPDEYLNAIKARGHDSPLFKYIPMLQFWRRYWFSDNERCKLLPISTRNIIGDLPGRSSPWPPLQEIFKRSFFYNLRLHFYKPNSESVKLDVYATLKEVISRCGLSRLNNSSFYLKPGVILYEELTRREESSPSFACRLLTYRYVKQMLENAVYMEKMAQVYPQICTKAIQRPLFIIGLDRTSNTLLQWILSQDPTNRTPRFIEMALPYGIDGSYRPHDLNCTSWDQDPRVPTSQDILDGILALSEPSVFSEMLRADIPYDDSVIFEQCGRSYTFCNYLEVPAYDNWLCWQTEERIYQTYLFHKRFLQHLEWQKPGERWILNSACHLNSLENLFKTYPDAVVVWIHRDPGQVIDSFCRSSRSLKKILYEKPNLTLSDQSVLRTSSMMINRALNFRQANPQMTSRFIDVHHSQFLQDILGTVKRIYKACGWQLTPMALKCMRLFLIENRHRKQALSVAPASGFGPPVSPVGHRAQSWKSCSIGEVRRKEGGKEKGEGADSGEVDAVLLSKKNKENKDNNIRCDDDGVLETMTVLNEDITNAFHSYYRSKYLQVSRRSAKSIVEQKLSEARVWLAGAYRDNNGGSSTTRNAGSNQQQSLVRLKTV